MRLVLLLALTAAALAGCDREDDADLRAEVALRGQALGQRIDDARSGAGGGSTEEPVARWELPRMLAEVSGLALTSDDRLFTHGDESGTIYEIDYRLGVVAKRFSLGPDAVFEDFEALAIRDSVFHLVTSRGQLHEFAEGAQGEAVSYRTRMAPVDRDECQEIEGAVFDPADGALLLACKQPRKGLREYLVLYRWDLATNRAERMDIPLERMALPDGKSWGEFSASAATRRPDNGNLLLLAGPEKRYLELTPEGAVVIARGLPKNHPQAEGVAVTSDGLLLIADEGDNRPATITVYAAPLQ